MNNFTLTRTRRKTIAIYIREGRVDVRAPIRASAAAIEAFVASKEGWIAGKLAESGRQQAERESFALSYGSILIYRGTPYSITATDSRQAGFDGERFFLPADLAPEQIKAACMRIYRARANSVLTEKARHYAQLMNVSPAAVKINSAKKRWGSCSARGSINFSWRLIMAEDDVIDYVVVHELAHLTELNHSMRFWAIVEAALPDYRARRKRLGHLQTRLAGENWEP